jgi:hypothetical protein
METGEWRTENGERRPWNGDRGTETGKNKIGGEGEYLGVLCDCLTRFDEEFNKEFDNLSYGI